MSEKTLSSAGFAQGTVVREPVGSGDGYWVGSPGLYIDPTDGCHYLSYRIRRPRGVEPDRGAENRIAKSRDGRHYDDVYVLRKAMLGTTSIERCALHRGNDGIWRFFIAYVNPEDARWCVSVIKAARLNNLDASRAEPVFRAPDLGLEGVKDPWICVHNGVYHMLVSVAVATAATRADSHATFDIMNTGDCLSATALATSTDLDNWQWHGVVFLPEAGRWDRYCRRINVVIPCGDKFLAFYDGSADHTENYEEKTGVAVSDDLRTWRSLSPEGPLFVSPHGRGAMRYIDAEIKGSRVTLYYELARPDGAHDLRTLETDLAAIAAAAGI